jgi:hypothetical protein
LRCQTTLLEVFQRTDTGPSNSSVKGTNSAITGGVPRAAQGSRSSNTGGKGARTRRSATHTASSRAKSTPNTGTQEWGGIEANLASSLPKIAFGSLVYAASIVDSRNSTSQCTDCAAQTSGGYAGLLRAAEHAVGFSERFLNTGRHRLRR